MATDDIEELLKKIAEDDIQFVDLRFTDTLGKWQHTAQHVSTITPSVFKKGLSFDGSSIAGWQDISQSDMLLRPDSSTVMMDPFTTQPQMILFCDIIDPSSGDLYDKDPRATARRALAYLQESGVGDTVYFGPEAEFFIFDDVRWSTEPYRMGYTLDAEETPKNSNTEYSHGNWAHRPREKGGYFPVPPVDSGTDIRAEMVTVLRGMGVAMEKHHHEVAPSQHELGMHYDTLLGAADALQIYKYCVHMVAHSYGKTATFMPKPVFGDNGSGMHCHQSIWQKGSNVFAGDQYCGLSDTCLYYIGGLLKHARALNAFTNPTVNSYKRLVPGFEAPVTLSYSERNRSAACRIPYDPDPQGKRVEVRFPDPSANPYFAFTAMLMAGLDGIKNKIHPGEANTANLYMSSARGEKKASLAPSLRVALDALDRDRGFLKEGGVMTDGLLDSYLVLKREEILRYNTTPHPVEFDMYYSV